MSKLDPVKKDKAGIPLEITEIRTTLQICKQLTLPLHFCKYILILAGSGLSQESDVETFKAPAEFWRSLPGFFRKNLDMRSIHSPEL